MSKEGIQAAGDRKFSNAVFPKDSFQVGLSLIDIYPKQILPQ